MDTQSLNALASAAFWVWSVFTTGLVARVPGVLSIARLGWLRSDVVITRDSHCVINAALCGCQPLIASSGARVNVARFDSRMFAVKFRELWKELDWKKHLSMHQQRPRHFGTNQTALQPSPLLRTEKGTWRFVSGNA